MNTSPTPEPVVILDRRGKRAVEVLEYHKPDLEACKRALRIILNAPEPRAPSNTPRTSGGVQ